MKLLLLVEASNNHPRIGIVSSLWGSLASIDLHWIISQRNKSLLSKHESLIQYLHATSLTCVNTKQGMASHLHGRPYRESPGASLTYLTIAWRLSVFQLTKLGPRRAS